MNIYLQIKIVAVGKDKGHEGEDLEPRCRPREDCPRMLGLSKI